MLFISIYWSSLNISVRYQAFTPLNRWPSHPDMIKQHATCIAKLLDEEYNLPEAEIYMDIWLSMNKRFKQRCELHN